MDGSGKMVSSRSAQRWVLAVTGAASFMVALDALNYSTAMRQAEGDMKPSCPTGSSPGSACRT